MKYKRLNLLSLFLFLGYHSLFSQSVNRNIKTPEYKELQKRFCTGWNTWYNNSVVSQVLLPEGFSINLGFGTRGGSDCWRDITDYKDGVVTLGLRSDNGEYTSLSLKYMDVDYEVQTATQGKDEFILISPDKSSDNQLVLETGILWNKEGTISVENKKFIAKFPNRTITVNSTEKPVPDAYAISTNMHLTIALNKEVSIYTGKIRSLENIKRIIAQKRAVQKRRADSYGKLSEAFTAMQTALAWNTIYDAPNHRAITTVSRSWSRGARGFVLFEWDTYFASYMWSMFDKSLAYMNAVEMTKTITPSGFVPNYQTPFGQTSWDRSQPPVGSTVILQIYKRYREKWFLEEVYDELLSWNRWWPENRDDKGYLAWGSDPTPSMEGIHNIQAAKYESGLDNSPMYDSIPFNDKKNVMELADVGLMSLYVMDCNSLDSIAMILGRKEDAKELKTRSAKYGAKLKELWDAQRGIYLNKRLDTGEKSEHLSPTNFYPLLAKVCTQKQAETMINKHYFNPNEFYGQYVMPSIARDDSGFGQGYWRGRIWGPMNFLVYLGMRNYNLPQAKKDLVERSMKLMMKNWSEKRVVCENYSPSGEPGGFYDWGALLGFMSFIEAGYMELPTHPKK